ncbi:MAG TPA: ABC transporter substrate-binding protein [Coleofasciculaceae cyanobacterium]|jgi:branched-chain amino acid transport system substrate-binding protein
MLKKKNTLNQKNFLLLLYIFILCVFGPAVYWLNNADNQFFPKVKTDSNAVQKRISIGDKILVTAHNSISKQAGVEAFADGDYVNAIAKFNSALLSDRNDPESRIYLNNTIAAKTEDPYIIGVSVPVGGNLNVAQEILRGVAQAQDEINHRGGINGKLMMIKIANDDNDSKIAQEIAERFVKDKKVLAVVGHNDSNASIAAAPIYQKSGLVMITPTSSAEVLATMGNYIFRTTPSTRDLAETLAEYAVKIAGKENITICIDSEAQVSVSFKENFTWAVYNYGGKITSLDCDLAAADFSPTEIPSQAVSQGADALLLAPSVRKVDKVIEIVAANEDRLTLLGNHSMTTYKTLKEGQKDANGMVLSVAWYPSLANSFTKNAEELWGGAVNWRTAMAYDATQALSKAIASGSERQKIQQVLANPEFSAQGASSTINFLPSGDRNLRGTLVEIYPGKKSGTGYDFVTLDTKAK